MRSFEGFCEQLLAALDVPCPAEAAPASSLYEGLGLDSFKVFELVVVTEELAGLVVPPPVTPVLLTLGDAYDYYREAWDLAQARSGSPASPPA